MSFSQLQIENTLSGVVEKHRFLHSMVHIASFCEHMLARKNTVVTVHDGASLIFMRCVVLEIQLLFRLHTGLVTGN